MSIKKLAAGVMAASVMMPALAFAQTTTSSVASLLDQLKALQAQIVSIQTQQQQIIAQFTTTLKEGSVGDQVTLLQQLLAADPTLFPEKKITGFFGRLTAQAVKRFQKKYGIEQAGNVGPKTLKKLNEIFGHNASSTNGRGHGDDARPCANNNGLHLGWTIGKGNQDKEHDCDGKENEHEHEHGTSTSTTDTVAPLITGVTVSSINNAGATITWTTNESATSQADYGTSASYGNTTSLNTSLVVSHGVTLTGLSASTVYHVRVLSKDAAGNQAASSDVTFTTSATTDTTPPTLSSITTVSISTTGATITWATNESATSQVQYGTSASYSNTTSLDTTLLTAHSVALTGLSASTVYHFSVVSKDSSLNTATSSDTTFTTLAPVDSAAPVIFSSTLTPTANSATVGWSTNELATGKVYYGTSTPVNLATAASVGDTTLVTTHTFNLTGLSASTTYYYVLESKDAANNTATTTTLNFQTQ